MMMLARYPSPLTPLMTCLVPCAIPLFFQIVDAEMGRAEEGKKVKEAAAMVQEKEREWKRERQRLEGVIDDLRREVERERERGVELDRLRVKLEVMKREVEERGEREMREKEERDRDQGKWRAEARNLSNTVESLMADIDSARRDAVKMEREARERGAEVERLREELADARRNMGGVGGEQAFERVMASRVVLEVERECSELRERLALALEEVSNLWEVRRLMQARLGGTDRESGVHRRVALDKDGNVHRRVALPVAGRRGLGGGAGLLGGERAGGAHDVGRIEGEEEEEEEEVDEGLIIEFGPPSP